MLPSPELRTLLPAAVPAGVEGTHGDSCQQIYQPAAAAERRFAERQRQAQAQVQAAAPAAPPQPAASGREEVATLRKEQAVYDRAAMAAQQERNTRELVDSMWQGLE